MKSSWIAGLVVALTLCASAAESAAALYRKARKAHAKGRDTQAFLLASQAVALDPGNSEYWQFSQALRARALPGLKLVALDQAAAVPASPVGADETLLPGITSADRSEVRNFQPPPVLVGRAGRHDFNLRGDAKQLFVDVGKAYGLDMVFDKDFSAGAPIQFRVTQFDFREALRALEAVTSSFVVPISEKVAIVVKDNAQKRAEQEPVASVVVPFPEPLTAQEVQEAVRAVQSCFDMTKVGIDTGRREVLFRDRVSRLNPALEIFRQLMTHRAQIIADVELLSFSADSSIEQGLTPQTRFPVVLYGNPTPFTVAESKLTYPSLGAGNSKIGVNIADATVVASLTHGWGQSMLRAQLRGVEGQPATLHIGDRYPVVTSSYNMSGTGNLPVSAAPTINFEDLGLTLKLTPHVHGDDAVTLELDAEFKSLTGSTINNIPVISNRKFSNRVRLNFGQTAIVAGLAQDSLNQSWSGLAPLTLLPGPRHDSKSMAKQEILLMVTPRLVSLSPAVTATPAVWVGTEGRSRSPID